MAVVGLVFTIGEIFQRELSGLRKYLNLIGNKEVACLSRNNPSFVVFAGILHMHFLARDVINQEFSGE